MLYRFTITNSLSLLQGQYFDLVITFGDFGSYSECMGTVHPRIIKSGKSTYLQTVDHKYLYIMCIARHRSSLYKPQDKFILKGVCIPRYNVTLLESPPPPPPPPLKINNVLISVYFFLCN